jgi:hypothetical protein
MLSILLVAAAAAMFFGVDAAKAKAAWAFVSSHVDAKKLAAVGLVILALLLMPRVSQDAGPQPDDTAGPLVLTGSFLGPTASEDASLIGALCHELADEIEFDGTQPEPYLKSGVAVDELRKAARVLRCRGLSIGDRQPKARDAIAAYLDTKVGTDGGPLSAEQRSAWVAAYRDIGRAASDASK